jgi:integrase
VRGPLFPTRTGGRLNTSNIRNRLLPETVQRANARRERAGRMLLPGRVTPHTLRRTWAMLALTAGRDARWVMAQMGHTDARLTLQVYAQAIQRQRIDHDLVWTLMRFADEPERRSGPGSPGAFGPTNGPMTQTDPLKLDNQRPA